MMVWWCDDWVVASNCCWVTQGCGPQGSSGELWQVRCWATGKTLWHLPFLTNAHATAWYSYLMLYILNEYGQWKAHDLQYFENNMILVFNETYINIDGLIPRPLNHVIPMVYSTCGSVLFICTGNLSSSENALFINPSQGWIFDANTIFIWVM